MLHSWLVGAATALLLAAEHVWNARRYLLPADAAAVEHLATVMVLGESQDRQITYLFNVGGNPPLP